MAIAESIVNFLDEKQVDYGVVRHAHTDFSMETAEAAHVSGELVAKGVVLKDGEGYLLAVLPATHTLHTEMLGDQLGRVAGKVVANDLDTALLSNDFDLDIAPGRIA